MEDRWSNLASSASLEKTVAALKKNGMEALVVEDGEAAKQKVLDMLGVGCEVMTMTSKTLETLGLTGAIQTSAKHISVRNQMMNMDREKDKKEMKKLGAVHDFVVGSVHAVTEEGQVMIASATGSQIPAYAYGANHVIWVVGTQKIVKNVADGFKRIYEHSLPLESERARKAYGVAGSTVGKVLIAEKETTSGRVTVLFVKEKLGF